MRHLVLLIALLAPTSVVRADGDEALGVRLTRQAPGLGITAAGAGFGRRRDSMPDVPLTSVTIELESIPTGAVVEQAYLYWAVYGGDGDPDLTLDGDEVTGTLIGTADDTCWPLLEDASNRVYRADITSAVEGNGEYVLTDLPATVAGVSDGQGASIVVIYSDPAATDDGLVMLLDGAATVSDTHLVMRATFPEVPATTATAAILHVGVGDGQVVGTDGQLIFNEVTLASEDPFQHFGAFDGTYWDVNEYDVLPFLPSEDEDIELVQAMESDCLVFAYAALALVVPHAPGTDAGAIDAGATDGGGLDASVIDVGASDAARFDGGVPGDVPGTVGTAGCGCRTSGSAGGAWWLLVAAAVMWRRRRR